MKNPTNRIRNFSVRALRVAISRERKEPPEIRWCQNDWICYAVSEGPPTSENIKRGSHFVWLVIIKQVL